MSEAYHVRAVIDSVGGEIYRLISAKHGLNLGSSAKAAAGRAAHPLRGEPGDGRRHVTSSSSSAQLFGMAFILRPTHWFHFNFDDVIGLICNFGKNRSAGFFGCQGWGVERANDERLSRGG